MTNPPQPDKDIEELAKDGFETVYMNSDLSWEGVIGDVRDNWRAIARAMYAKLRTLGWEKVDRATTEELGHELDRLYSQYDAKTKKALSRFTDQMAIGRVLAILATAMNQTQRTLKAYGYRSPSEIRAIERDAVERGAKLERLKFSYWLMDKYLIKTGNTYRITKENLAELDDGIVEKPEWNRYPQYQKAKSELLEGK
jgi:hypothetical protein